MNVPRQPRTCGGCRHRDEEGDCVWLLEGDVPQWLRDAAEPFHDVDADASAEDCETWEAK